MAIFTNSAPHRADGKFPRQRWIRPAVIGLFVFLVAMCHTGSAYAQPTAENKETDAPIDQRLFQDLQSDKYRVRENATEQLSELGSRVLPEVAKRYFTAPPETVYRIRKILEGVGSSGDEQTFLRATSLLLTLYSSGNQEMVERISLLKAQWRKRRKKDALQAILAAGGKVKTGFSSSQPQVQLRQALINRQAQQFKANQNATKTTEPKQKLDVGQQRVLVATIMTNSAEENRDYILQHSKTNRLSEPWESQYSYGLPYPSVVSFPDGWIADDSILAKLDELDGPVALTLGALEMNQEQWRVVKNTALIISVDVNGKALPNLATDAFPEDVRDVTLRECALDEDFCKSLSQFSSLGRLTLSNCNLDMDSVEALNQLKRVSSIPIDFTDTKVDADSISALSKLKRVRAITMKNATVSPAALARFATLPPISSLKLASMLIDDKFFESVGRMKRLTLLQLNGCKFDVEAFKQLESTGRVRIEFQPRAFLGVGPVAAGRPGSMGCQIAYIAPNSAAAGNGIQVGDVIRAIDGDEVRTFKEVRLKIAQYDPGEKMSMEIQRAGKTLELNIELGKNNPVDR